MANRARRSKVSKDKRQIITKNITTLESILNVWRVLNRIPVPANNTYAVSKWSNTMFTVQHHLNDTQNITGDGSQLPYFQHIGCTDTLFSHDYYNKVHEVVTKVNAQFYTQVDAGYNDQLTEVVLSIIAGSATVYGMGCALYRTQTGYLIKDEDKTILGPIFFNHEDKGASTNDWNVGNNHFAETVLASNLNTQARVQSSGQVWGCYSIANEPWSNMITNLIADTYMTPKMRAVLEHLFTNVFIDPSFTDNVRSVTLFPASCFRLLSTPNSNGDITVTIRSLNNLNVTPNQYYDTLDSNDGSSSNDNATTWGDFLDYLNDWHDMINSLFSYYSQLDTILAELGLENTSSFNFTRTLSHDQVSFIINENIGDFIQTVTSVQNGACYPYGAPYAQAGQNNPFVTRSEQAIELKQTINYDDEVALDLNASFEMMYKLKIYPARFIYYGKDTSGNPYYRIQYSVITVASGFSVAQTLDLLYTNGNLTDHGCVQTLFNNEIGSIKASGLRADDLITVPGIRAYYTPLENLGLYSGRAWDTILGK